MNPVLVQYVPCSRSSNIFGFTDDPSSKNGVLVVPRDAVLSAGSKSVVYVETEPGHFEIRKCHSWSSC